jgi:histone-lysine N-methyltransferase SETD2
MECECTTSEYDRSRGIKACGYECLNRMLLIECSTNCPCGHWCTNRRFQRRSYADHKLALFKTEMKGYGLRTISSIRKGRFLVEYVGEVIDMDELARRNKKYKRDGNIHQYVMSLIHGTVIDSTIKGNWARYINHSCEPNCSAEKWLVNGEYRMGIFAKRDLDVDEEITIDYRFETFGAVDLANEKCYCGAPTCRGTISLKSKNHLNKRTNRRQPLDDDELIDYLRDDDTNEYIVPKTIEEIRQLIQIMSRTDSENVRTIELDLIRNNSQKQFELPRLFLECNGLHVLCSWMKDILIEDDEHQQYSDEFKYHLLDFIHSVLPIKDRTTVIKNGLLDLIYKKLKLPLSTTDNIDDNNTDQEQINQLMNSILDHLDNPIIAKLL